MKQLKGELELFKKLLHRNMNQYRRTIYFRSLMHVSRVLQLWISRRSHYLHQREPKTTSSSLKRNLQGLLSHNHLLKEV
jgi:hypothetical protein